MADLSKIIELMDIKVGNHIFNNQVYGKKRRYWLTSENNDQNNNETTTRKQLDNNETTTRKQLDNNETTTRKQLDNNETTTRKQLDNDRDNNQDNNKIITGQQLDKNIKGNCFFLIQNLIGIQKKLFVYIFNLCLERDEISTGHISTANISSIIGCSCGTTKVMLSRLEKKGLVKRLKGKGCRGGFVNFEIPKNIKILALQMKKEFVTNLDNNEITTRQQLGNNRDNDQDNTCFSSSSYIYKTTTEELQNPNQLQPQLPSVWQNLDVEPLAAIGFTLAHLSQIATQNKLQPQMVQDSIYSFSFDLQENGKAKSIKGDPINYFMGILRNGRVYTFPSNYESPQDKAMRLYAEQRRVIEQKKKSLEKESLDLAFDEWFGELTESQKIAFLPENIQNTKIAFGKNKVIESAARSHFEKEIWTDMKQTIIKSAINPDQGMHNQIPTNIEQEASNVENN